MGPARFHCATLLTFFEASNWRVVSAAAFLLPVGRSTGINQRLVSVSTRVPYRPLYFNVHLKFRCFYLMFPRVFWFRAATAASRPLLSVCYKRTKADAIRKQKREKIALPTELSNKIERWKQELQQEIEMIQSHTEKIHGLLYKDFNVHATSGCLLELYFPADTPERTLNNWRLVYRNGVWITLFFEDETINGVFLDYTSENTIQLRIFRCPEPSILSQTNISMGISAESTVFCSILEFWSTPEAWKREPGYKLFLQAHHAIPMKFGYSGSKMKFYNENLNEGQERVIKKALQKEPGLISIQGPPGTGKTKVLTEIIAQAIKRNQRVLVMAPSNKAVDNVASRTMQLMSLPEEQFQLHAEDKAYSLSSIFSTHKDYDELVEMSHDATESWEYNHRRVTMAQNKRMEIYDDIVAGTRGVYATLSSSAIRKLKQQKFDADLVIIDEAAQAPEYLAWIGIMKARHAIIVGDQWQLGPSTRRQETPEQIPTVMDHLDKEFGSKIQQRLTRQYRSNEKIMLWSNNAFYDGQLEADESVKDININEILENPLEEYYEPLIFIDTKNAGASYEQRRQTTSLRNDGEAHEIVKHVQRLMKAGLPAKDIGVITPYLAQANCIKQLLNKVEDLVVSTVDAFQGQEREVICMSLVRTQGLGFLKDLRRMNVSITRAKRQFFLVANSDVLEEDSALAELHRVLKENETNRMDSQNIEIQAEIRALEQVQNMFQRPEQLEKLDVVRKKADGKKAAVEAMLRTGVHSQLEGIRSAIQHLRTANSDITEIERGMSNVLIRLKEVTGLKSRMSKLSEANAIHSQYAAAMDNLKHIFNITDTVEKTHSLIADGKLLLAHKNIMDLENARDDLMNEVHKMQSDRSEYDLNLLKNYFSELDILVANLGKQLWFICEKALLAVNADESSKQLVSALRIIERENRIDDHYRKLHRQNPNTFVPPGRPRLWKKQLFVVLKKMVDNKIEGSQFEDRSANRQWLARYLEVISNYMLNDLKIVKSGLVALFPPEYRIYDRFLEFYHSSVSERIKEIASVSLERNEIVQLLSWIKNYGSESMLGDPKLGIEIGPFLVDNPLLPRSKLDQLFDGFIDSTQRDLHSWMERALSGEKDDWYRNIQPEEDSAGHYYSQLPSILFGMVDDQVTLTKVISHAVIPRLINVSIDELLEVAVKYKDATTAYRNKHFENREVLTGFTSTMIAIANNIDGCVMLTNELEKKMRLTIESQRGDLSSPTSPKNSIESPLTGRSLASMGVNRQELLDKVDQLKKRWGMVLETAIFALLDEVFEDCRQHLNGLMTREWLTGKANPLGVICETVTDYNRDYCHLRTQIQFTVLKEVMYKIVAEYLIAIDSRRLTYNNYKERQLAGERLKEEAERIERTFNSISEKIDYPFPLITSVLPSIAEIVNMTDKSLLSLEVSGFVRKFPDVHPELIAAVLLCREDIGRNEAKSIAEEALNHVRFHPKGDQEMIKLFQMTKAEGKRTIALEGIVQSFFPTFTMIATRDRGTS
ncbi:Proable exocyst complex component Sec6 [Aphelenchoides besseyi]|nr:Proable exocyst complex component Sec6 [Aphelenchoides besseyi]